MAQSNRLPTLADEAKQAHNESLDHAQKAAERALAAGAALNEAKGLCAHGTWGDWLAQTGIPQRSAQRYMKLHSAGLKSDTVSDLGGIAAALSFLSKWQMPGTGEALHICVPSNDPEDFAFVWRDEDHSDHVCIGAVIGENDVFSTKRPMPPLIEVEGDQPVDAVLTWLEARGLSPSADWQITTVSKKSADMVIMPILAETLICNPSGRV